MTVSEPLREAWVPPRPDYGFTRACDNISPQAAVAIACRVLYEAGYEERGFGHVTLEQPDGTYLTNGYEASWDCIRACDILPVDADGQKVSDHRLHPNWGLNLHASLRRYVPREKTTCVIHGHPRYGILWSVLGVTPPIYDQGSARLPDDVYMTSDPTEFFLNEGDALAIGEAGWALMARHGAISVATSLAVAVFRLMVLEHRSRFAWELSGRPGAQPMKPEWVADRQTMIPQERRFDWWDAEMRRMIALDPTVLD